MPKGKNVLGAWAFLIGAILAVIVGLLPSAIPAETAAVILVVLGLIIGLLNVGGAELKDFLLAGTALVIVSYFGSVNILGVVPFIGEIFRALMVLFVPATIVVALKSVFAIARK